MDNVVSIQKYIDKKDLESYAKALTEQTIKLQIENQQLKDRLEHLEELLKHAPVLEVGRDG